MKKLLITTLVLIAAGLARAESTSSSSATPAAVSTPAVTPATREGAPFLDAFPNMREYVAEEPKSGLYFGLGASPVGMVKDRLLFSLDFFQLHYLSDRWNWALLNATYASARGQSDAVQSTHFIFRTTPKYRIGKTVSFGPLVGYEFVSFPNISSQLTKNNYHTPSEPFSSRGVIVGAELAETFNYGRDYLFQITQTAFRQSYSTSQTQEKWQYQYDDATVAANTSLIEANTVIAVGFSFLY